MTSRRKYPRRRQEPLWPLNVVLGFGLLVLACIALWIATGGIARG